MTSPDTPRPSPNHKTLYSVATVTVEHAPLASCILSTILLTISSFQHLPLSPSRLDLEYSVYLAMYL